MILETPNDDVELIAGIDCGVTGAVAWLHRRTARFQAVVDMPVREEPRGSKATVKRQIDPFALARILTNMRPAVVVVERVNTMPGQGVASSGSIMESLGIVKGVCGALDLSMLLVWPPKWKRHHGLLGTDKDAGRLLAIDMFPQAELGLKKHHNRADALLLAKYGVDKDVAGLLHAA